MENTRGYCSRHHLHRNHHQHHHHNYRVNHHHQAVAGERENSPGRPAKPMYLRTIFFALMLMQHAELFACHQGNRLQEVESPDSDAAKRSPVVSGGSGSQPEEIFYAGNQLEMNYDEYPMVVPKRAALLLDRLMVALHRALEKEQQRLSDYYPNREDLTAPSPFAKSHPAKGQADQVAAKSFELGGGGDERIAMYSDDDPSVIMDYDFKDLGSINRATGETLVGKSFQRRANIGMDFMGGNGNGGDFGGADSVMAMLAPGNDRSMPLIGGGGEGGGGGGSGGGGGGGGFGNSVRQKSIGSGRGRMYWRCYFNAVSCF